VTGGKTEGNQVVEAINALSIFGPHQAGAYREHADEVRGVLGPDIETKVREYVKGWGGGGVPGILILTGNAGTGKTALVEAYCETVGAPRPREDSLLEVTTDKFVVKDFSGMKRSERGRVMKLSREIRSGRSTQLFVCANEGVLREALLESADPELEELLDGALESGASRTEADGGVVIVNMNRQRWTSEKMWSLLLDYFVREELWEKCGECANAGACPIQANAAGLRQPGPREAARRLTQFASGGSVSTLRELLSILSYSITGGLTCEEVGTQIQPFDAGHGYFNLFVGEGLSRERLERSPLIQEMRSAELGLISDVQVDGWLRDPGSAPQEISALADPDVSTPHSIINTLIGPLTFQEFGEVISISDDPRKVEDCMHDYVDGRRILELWRRRIFFGAHGALGGWQTSFVRLTNQTAFGELMSLASALRQGRDTNDARRAIILGLNYLTSGFAKFGGTLVIPDPGSLTARNPGTFRRPEPSIVHSKVRVEKISLEVEDGPDLMGILDTDDVRVVLKAKDHLGVDSHLFVTPRLFDMVVSSGRFRSPAGSDLPEINELLGFYAALSSPAIEGPLEIVDPSLGVIRPITLPTL
jgi:hypothetical protein